VRRVRDSETQRPRGPETQRPRGPETPRPRDPEVQRPRNSETPRPRDPEVQRSRDPETQRDHISLRDQDIISDSGNNRVLVELVALGQHVRTVVACAGTSELLEEPLELLELDTAHLKRRRLALALTG
jgi:hypothetical protein